MGRFKLGQKPGDPVANALNPEHNLITSKGTVNMSAITPSVMQTDKPLMTQHIKPQPQKPDASSIVGTNQREQWEKMLESEEWKIRQQQWRNSSGAVTSGLGNIAFDAFKKDPEGALNWLPYAGEMIDAKNTIKDASQGDYLGAAANAAGLMIPFVPGGVVKGALKTGLKKLENVFYPNTVYRSQVVGKNRINYKNANTPQAVKVNEKGDFYTSNFDDAEFYARGDFKHTAGIKQGDDVVMSQAKLPFWMRPTTKDKDVINLKKLTNDAPSPDEYLVPSGGFSSMFVKKKDFAIKGMPEHIRNTKETQMFIGNRPIQREGNPYYNTEGGKYVLDQFEGAKSYFKNK